MRSLLIIIFLLFVGSFIYAFPEQSASKYVWPPATVPDHTVRTDEGNEQILFVGDIMLGRDVERRIGIQGLSYPYKGIGDLLSEHGHVVGNFEASVPKVHVQTPDMTFAFSVREDILSALIDAGFTHLSLANNHAFDHGRIEYEHTVKKIREFGAAPFGMPYTADATAISYIDTGRERIALIAIDMTLHSYSPEVLNSVLQEASKHSELQFVFLHWGVEYATTHSDAQEHWAQLLVSYGADLIIGHHPHVVQDIAHIDDVPVFYSLGNFIFDQYFTEEVMRGLVLSVDVNERSIALMPVSSEKTLIAPELLSGESKTNFLSELAERSDAELSEHIKAGHIPF